MKKLKLALLIAVVVLLSACRKEVAVKPTKALKQRVIMTVDSSGVEDPHKPPPHHD